MISIKHSAKTLNIVLPNTNRALKEVLQNSSPKELQTLSLGKDLDTIIKGLLEQSKENPKADKMLLELAKKNPTLKELGSLTSSTRELVQLLKKETTPLALQKQLTSFLSDIKDISPKNLQAKILDSGLFLENRLKNIQAPQVEVKVSLQELTKLLESSKLPNVRQLATQIKELLSSDVFKSISNENTMKNIKPDISQLIDICQKVQTLRERIVQRMESNLDKSMSPNDILFSKDVKELVGRLTQLIKPENLIHQTHTKESLSHDFKAILLKAQEEIQNSTLTNKQELLKHIDKTLLTIDYQQLVSHLSNATSLFIPYSWNALEEGEISIKSAKDGKFFTDIELQLKKFGLLKLRLGIFEENQLNININAQTPALKTILQKNIPILKKQLTKVGVIPMSIRFLDETPSSAYEQSSQNVNAGFEVKA